MRIQRAEAINADARTVEVAFSSESVIEDWPGHSHKLSHDEGAVDLSRLNDAAAVLVNHHYSDQVGVVERAWIDGGDRVGRAVLRFGKSDRAQEVFQDVVDGIRQHISVGAAITGSIEREEKDGAVILHVQEWQPIEISIASVPADPNVGIGRSQEPKPIEPKRTKDMDHDEVNPDAAKIEKDVLQRLNQIHAIGQEYDAQELANEYATNGKTSERDIIELNKRAFEHWLAKQEAEVERQQKNPDKPTTHLGLSDKETKRYSITRMLEAQLSGNWKGAELEKECSAEIARVLDREPNGIFVPHDIQMRAIAQLKPEYAELIKREMNTGTPGTGQELVGTFHDAANFIDLLRVTTQAVRLGGRMLPGLRQNLSIPKKTAGATFEWLAEGGTVTLSDLGTGAVTLSPKTVGGGVAATRRMLKQSSPAIDDLIMQDLVEGAAEAIDLGAFEGDGTSNQPVGIVNQAGVNTQVVNPAGQPTWAEVVGFETAVAADNALRGSLAWALTSGVVGYLKTTEKATGTGRFIMDNEGLGFGGTPNTLNGYPVGVQNALDAGRMIFGNYNDLLLGMWGVLDLRPDPYTNAASDGLIIRAFQDIDVAVRHGESFCINVLV